MKIPAEEAAKIALSYRQELVVVAGYDGRTLEVATFGNGPMAKDMAADWGDAIPAALGFDAGARMVHEDYRATPEAVAKKRIDDLTLEVQNLRLTSQKADDIIREIAFVVPTVTNLGRMRVCDVEQVFRLKKMAAEARDILMS
jgi:hypothetical protein